MIVITDVTQYSKYCVTSVCQCHPRRRVTGAPRWVRRAQVDFHDGVMRGITIDDWRTLRAAEAAS